MCGCGGASTSTPVGHSTAAPRPRALELSLRRPSGQWIHIGDLRGRPVLLFVFATFDAGSQAALRPLKRFARNHPSEVHVIGVAAQPDANLLVDAYEHALTPGFPMTYDPARNVHLGTSSLGVISAVPTFIMLDAYGREAGRWVGFPNTRTLDRLLNEAVSRGGLQEHTPQPLMAE